MCAYFCLEWFLVDWHDTEDNLHDVLPAKRIEAEDVLAVEVGTVQKCFFDGDGKVYDGLVKARGQSS